ncbi:MAG: (2Fe-2S)-binding protein [Desulfatirhabdiaceae bacterium]
MEFPVYVDNQPVMAKEGQSIADVMLSAGIRNCRTTRNQNPRGVFCGMGICHECCMIVDDIPNIRTCMTTVRPGMRIASQKDSQIGTRS